MLLISTSIDWCDDPTDPSLMISYQIIISVS
nr:MAG TPA: hypothetical protein [Caudoviricetes sp.]